MSLVQSFKMRLANSAGPVIQLWCGVSTNTARAFYIFPFVINARTRCPIHKLDIYVLYFTAFHLLQQPFLWNFPLLLWFKNPFYPVLHLPHLFVCLSVLPVLRHSLIPLCSISNDNKLNKSTQGTWCVYAYEPHSTLCIFILFVFVFIYLFMLNHIKPHETQTEE